MLGKIISSLVVTVGLVAAPITGTLATSTATAAPATTTTSTVPPEALFSTVIAHKQKVWVLPKKIEVRKHADNTSQVVTTVTRHQKVVQKLVGDYSWAKIKANGVTGWVDSTLLSPVKRFKWYTNESGVAMQATVNVNSKVIKTVAFGKKVKLRGIDQGAYKVGGAWYSTTRYKVKFHHKTGWVDSLLLVGFNPKKLKKSNNYLQRLVAPLGVKIRFTTKSNCGRLGLNQGTLGCYQESTPNYIWVAKDFKNTSSRTPTWRRVMARNTARHESAHAQIHRACGMIFPPIVGSRGESITDAYNYVYLGGLPSSQTYYGFTSSDIAIAKKIHAGTCA